MKPPPDYNQRAGEFIKLWQEQMTRQMHNPDMIRSMLAAMQSFGGASHDAHPQKPADAPDAGADAVRRMERRIDALERELAGLHARLLSMDAKAKNPARTGKRGDAKPVAKRGRTMGGSQRSVPAKPKPKRK